MASIMLAVFLLVGLQSSAMAMVLVDVDVDIDVNVDAEGHHTPSPDLRSVQTGDSCQDCTKIFELLVDMLSNADLQKKMIDGLDTVCDHLPSSAAKLCREEVGKFFPLAITIITKGIKPGQACALLGLCDTQALSRQNTQLLSLPMMDLTAAMTDPQPVGFFHQCAFCKLLIQTLVRLLPKERTEGKVLELLGEVCSYLPSFLHTQCESLIDKYGKEILDKLLAFASPQTICTFIHMCKGQEGPEEVSLRSDCDSCVSLVAVSHLWLSSNSSSSSHLQTSSSSSSSFLPAVCLLLPSASWSECEAFTQLYGHQLPGLLGKQEAPLDVCRALGVCGGAEPQRGGDPCTLSSYRCRDMETARHCETVRFCQMFVWKTVSSNHL